MKKHVIVLLSILFTALFMTACSSDGTGDLESLMKKQADVMEKFVDGMEKAQSADDMVKVIETYTAGMKELIPQLQEFQKKYPDFENGVVPKGLEDEVQRVEQASSRFSSAMMNSMRFMMDAKVQEAMAKMSEEISEQE
ncbi:MAG: hypothetical protein R2940_02220 [Syntrophotaleaceae bacterium]